MKQMSLLARFSTQYHQTKAQAEHRIRGSLYKLFQWLLSYLWTNFAPVRWWSITRKKYRFLFRGLTVHVLLATCFPDPAKLYVDSPCPSISGSSSALSCLSFARVFQTLFECVRRELARKIWIFYARCTRPLLIGCQPFGQLCTWCSFSLRSLFTAFRKICHFMASKMDSQSDHDRRPIDNFQLEQPRYFLGVET